MSKIFIGSIFANIYHRKHPKVSEDKIPYWYKRLWFGEVWHLIRKGICQNIAPNCVFTPVRIGLYRMCGFMCRKFIMIHRCALLSFTLNLVLIL